MTSYDVICVGGGFGGSGCATVLARAGLGVLVLEPTTEFPDIVRGEWLGPWGVAHTQATGLYDDLVAAGGFTVAKHITFDETIAPQAAIDAAFPLNLVPDVAGPLTMRHPDACQALSDAASTSGAEVVRGVRGIHVTKGEVRYVVDGTEHNAAARMIIGSDGRGSPLRTALGITLEKSPTGHYLGGVLVDGVDFVEEDTEFAATEGDLHTLLFPQGGGRGRLYICFDEDRRIHFSGKDRAERYLEAFVMDCWPGSEAFRDVEIAGPANAYGSIDTWCERPYDDGVVLVGDAAGYNDPLIGQGLSITSADTRAVTETLLGDADWQPGMFAAYAEERVERMRRLRITAQVHAVSIAAMGRGRDPATRKAVREDPTAQMLTATVMIGPNFLPAEVYDEAVASRLITGS